MLSALGKAFGQLGDPRLNWVILVSFIGALAISVLVIWLAFAMTGWFDYFEDSWLDWLATAATWAMGPVFVFFLFPAFVTMVAGALLEYVARAVEARHYPNLAPARDVSIMEDVAYAVKFGLFLIAVNILALPIYVVLIFLPPLGLVFSWILNGYLLGREFFEMVAMRRMPLAEAKRLRKQRRGEVFAAGVVVAVMMAVPLLNLISPVVATAFMAHIFHRGQGSRAPRRASPPEAPPADRAEPSFR